MDLAKDLTKFYDRIISHPIGLSIVREDEDRRLARRRELVGKLKAFSDAAIAKRLAPLEATAVETLAAYQRAKLAADEALAAHAAAVGAVRAARFASCQGLPEIEAELRRTASPAIEAFLDTLDKDTEKMRRSDPDIEAVDGRPMYYQDGWDKPGVKKGDKGAFLKHTILPRTGWAEKAIQVHAQARALALQDLAEAEVRARLDALTAELNRAEAAA